MAVSNPMLLVLNPHSPMSLSYIYLLNTERSSSGVRINDLANGLECAIFQNIGLSRQGREVFRSDWTERYWKMIKCVTSTSSPPRGL